jgi:hypothetical protein
MELFEVGIEAHDPYLGVAYQMRVFLGLVSVDSPARAGLDHHSGTAGTRGMWCCCCICY